MIHLPVWEQAGVAGMLAGAGSVAAFRDRRRRRLRSASAGAATDAEMRRFLRDAALGLRGPIGGMRAGAEALLLARPEEQAPIAESIAAHSARAGRMISDLLAHARVDGLPAATEPVDFDALLAEEAALARASAPHLDVDVKAPRRPAPIAVDLATAQEAIANVLDNAIRHARRRVSIVLADGDAGVTITIRDDGLGVDSADAETMFRPFVALDGHGGSGLGLSVARAGVRATGGDLIYRAKAFVLTFPR